MTSSAEDRRGLLVLAVLGAVANVIAVIQFAGSHLPAVIVGALVLWILLWIYGRALWGFLRRHHRDLAFLVLGAALSAAGIEGHRLWKPDVPAPDLKTAPVAPAFPPLIETGTPIPDPPEQSEIVYRTSSGERYHRAGCRYIKGKGIPISLKEAKASGLTPCKVCRPPSLP